MNLLSGSLCFLSGIFIDMSMVHLFNFSETAHHPMITRSKSSKLAGSARGLRHRAYDRQQETTRHCASCRAASQSSALVLEFSEEGDDPWTTKASSLKKACAARMY